MLMIDYTMKTFFMQVHHALHVLNQELNNRILVNQSFKAHYNNYFPTYYNIKTFHNNNYYRSNILRNQL